MINRREMTDRFSGSLFPLNIFFSVPRMYWRMIRTVAWMCDMIHRRILDEHDYFVKKSFYPAAAQVVMGPGREIIAKCNKK